MTIFPVYFACSKNRGVGELAASACLLPKQQRKKSETNILLPEALRFH